MKNPSEFLQFISKMLWYFLYNVVLVFLFLYFFVLLFSVSLNTATRTFCVLWVFCVARCCRFERSNLNKTATALVCSKSLKTKFPERDSAHIFTHTLSAPRRRGETNTHAYRKGKAKPRKNCATLNVIPPAVSLSLTHTHSLSLCALLCCAVDVAASQSQSPSTLQSLRCFCAALSLRVCLCVWVREWVLHMAAATLAALLLAPKRAVRVCVWVRVLALLVCVCAACCFWRKKKQTVAAAFFSTAQIAQLAAGCNRALMHVCVCLCVRVCAYSAGQAYRKNWLTLCFLNMFPKK